MTKTFEVRWQRAIAAPPDDVWDAITRKSSGWLWPIEYEPWVGGAERGLAGGTVTAWEQPRHFQTRAGDNQLDYQLRPTATGTEVSYVHTGAFEVDDYDRELDACEQHTDLYAHSFAEYVHHFAGRDATYQSADTGTATETVRARVGVPADATAGTEVRVNGVDGVVDYVRNTFIGVRTPDALIRIYGREPWGWPIGIAVHDFANDDRWNDWLTGVAQ